MSPESVTERDQGAQVCQPAPPAPPAAPAIEERGAVVVPIARLLRRRTSRRRERAPEVPRRARSLTLAELLQRSFWCRRKHRRVSLERCLDGYVEHTARQLEGSDCTGCEQGRQNRWDFSLS